jgi:hypothetical protein
MAYAAFQFSSAQEAVAKFATVKKKGGSMNKTVALVSAPVKSAFIRRAVVTSEQPKRSRGGIPANAVIAKLEAKLAAARDRKS